MDEVVPVADCEGCRATVTRTTASGCIPSTAADSQSVSAPAPMWRAVALKTAEARSLGVWWRSFGPMMPLGRRAIVANSGELAKRRGAKT